MDIFKTTTTSKIILNPTKIVYSCDDTGRSYRISNIKYYTGCDLKKTGVSTIRNFYIHEEHHIMCECLIDGTINYYTISRSTDECDNVKNIEIRLIYSHNFYNKLIVSHYIIQHGNIYILIIEDVENFYIIGKNIVQIYNKKSDDLYITIDKYEIYLSMDYILYIDFYINHDGKKEKITYQTYDFNTNINQNFSKNIISKEIIEPSEIYYKIINDNIFNKVFDHSFQLILQKFDSMNYKYLTMNNEIKIIDRIDKYYSINKLNPITVQKIYKINKRDIYIHCELDGMILYYEINDNDNKCIFLFSHKLINGPIYSYYYFKLFYHYILIENKENFYLFRNLQLLQIINKKELLLNQPIVNNIIRHRYTNIYIEFIDNNKPRITKNILVN